MNRYLIVLVTLVLASLILITACKKDIVLEPLPTLEGSYMGIYRVITGYQTPSADTSTSSVAMLFSEESYFFNSDNTPDAFCNPRGSYTLAANNIELSETDRNCSSVIAKERDNPRGQFSIRRPGDSVICIQQTADTLKQILLQKK